jgi:hypothetical protein
MTARKRAWVLNLEADDARARGRGWTPSKALYAMIDARAQALARSLVLPGDLVLERDDPRVLGDEYTGAAWSITERAIAQWKRARVKIAPTPSPALVDRVSSRAFAQRLTPSEPREIEVRRSTLEATRLPDGPARVSTEHTCAGRGHFTAETPEQTRFILARLLTAHERAYVAERVEVLADFALHGWVSRDRVVTLGSPTEQRVDRRTGAWIETVAAAPESLSIDEQEALVARAREAGVALADEGYFGPFGIDAFRFRDRDGRSRFCARCELNARYTMGWAIGMGPLRAAIDERP